MMDQIIDTLHLEQCSLVVLHEGNIREFSGKGLRNLYNLINQEPELFLDAKVAVKAIGSTAARMLVTGGVCEVYADVLSNQACDILEDAGIKVTYEKKVDHARFLHVWEQMGE